jgi:two-component system sensor histidine kinase MtrB
MSLQARLATMVSLLAGGVAAFIFLYFPGRLEHQAVEAAGAKARSISAMTAHSISPGLAAGDVRAMYDGLRGALQNRDLAYLVVTDRKGRVLHAVNHTPEAVDTLLTDAGGHLGEGVRAGGYYQVASRIRGNDGGPLGTLYLGLSLEELEQMLAASRRTTALASLVLFLAGTVVVIGIGLAAARPLSTLAQTAERIAEGDLTQRAAIEGPWEVRRMARAFNTMVDNLGGSQRELAALNRHLEDRVTAQTAELLRAKEELRAARRRGRAG